MDRSFVKHLKEGHRLQKPPLAADVMWVMVEWGGVEWDGWNGMGGMEWGRIEWGRLEWGRIEWGGMRVIWVEVTDRGAKGGKRNERG